MCGEKKKKNQEKQKKKVFLSGEKCPSFVLSEIWLFKECTEQKKKEKKIKSLKEMVGIHNYQNLQTRQDI